MALAWLPTTTLSQENVEAPEAGKQVLRTIELPANRSDWPPKQSREATLRRLHEPVPADPNDAETVRYWLYLPKDDESRSGKKYPLLLFLHGAGERGSDPEKVKVHGPPKLCEKADSWPMITVSPQCPSDKYWSAEQLILLLDHLMAVYSVDEDRIYVTGLSMGGYGSWMLACEIPDRLAAVAPICGGGDPEQAERLVDLPVWAFHGGADPVVPPKLSGDMIEAIRRAGGRHAKLTIYPEARHDSWTETYNDPDFYQWLQAQSRD
jgi:predicted peptidase